MHYIFGKFFCFGLEPQVSTAVLVSGKLSCLSLGFGLDVCALESRLHHWNG